jgi:threonine 3-dehydrogenase
MSDNVPITMKSPHFLGGGRIEFIEKAVPEPGPGQLLIQVKANALCGSERPQFYNGSEVIPGHEAAGIVAAAGPETHTPVGTPGVIYLMDFCGQCRSCRQGFTNQCLDKRGDMGFNKDGGYGQYELVHEAIFFPVNDDIPLTETTMLLDIMGTGGHAIKRGQLVHPDIQSLVITGAGPVGLGVLAMAKLLLRNSITVLLTDLIPYRLKLAEQLGGVPIQLGEQTLQEGLQAHGLDAVDVAIDTSGKGMARQTCMDALAKRGVLVCVGHGEGLDLNASRDLIAPERAVLGSEYFSYNELPENLELLHANRAYLSQIVTHRYGVDRIQEAFEVFFSGDTGKVVIEQ